MCLANPISPATQVCAYINRQNGLVTACDSGCCTPSCSIDSSAPNILQTQNELRPSAGTELPEGFGAELQTSDEPTRTKYASDYVPPDTVDEKVWQRMIIPILMLVIVLLAINSLA
jgi:hypothetical protein